jgi:hypothetical protein
MMVRFTLQKALSPEKEFSITIGFFSTAVPEAEVTESFRYLHQKAHLLGSATSVSHRVN